MSDLNHYVGNADAFPILRRWQFFNHAGVSPLPHVAAQAMRRYADDFEQNAYLSDTWKNDLAGLRASAATLINAAPDEIACIKNTAEGICTVAYGLDWHPGDRVVTTGVEYPSNMYPWMDLARRFGVELVVIAEQLNDDGSRSVPIELLLEAVSHPKTKLLAISHVEFASGQRHDLVRLGAACRQHSVLLSVDAIQSLGVVPVDVQTMNIDFLSADGHKWLLGPLGAGIFYIRKELMDRTRPLSIGATSVVNAHDYGTYDLTFRHDAARYESGALNLEGLFALRASIDLLLEVGIDSASRQLKKLGDRLITGLHDRHFTVISPRAGNQWSGNVSFTVPGQDHQAIYDKLKANQTEIALRVGRLRVSPHFYNTEQQIDRLLDLL